MPRDYQKEYQNVKKKKQIISAQIPIEIAEDFRSKCYLNETTPNAFLKACIDAYLDNSLVYENGKVQFTRDYTE